MVSVVGLDAAATPRARQTALSTHGQALEAGLRQASQGMVDTAQRRSEGDAVRQAQLEQLDSNLADRESLAGELADKMTRVGMTDAAERFRRSNRRAAFNAARRGISGGSAAIQQEQALQAQAEQEGQQAAAQAEASAMEQVLKAQQQRDKLAQEVIKQNPFEADLDRLGLSSAERENELQAALRQIQQQRAMVKEGQQGALGNLIGGLLNTGGQVIGNFTEASA